MPARVLDRRWPCRDWRVERTSPPPRADQPRQSSEPGGRLIVCGLPGDDEHRKLFARDRRETAQGADRAIRISRLRGAGAVRSRPSKSGDGPALPGARGLSNREGIAADVDELRKRLGAGRHALGDRPGPWPLRRPAFSPEHPGPGPRRTGVRQALRGPQGARAGLLHHHARQRLLPQAAGRDRPDRDHGDRGRPGGQRDAVPARPGRRARSASGRRSTATRTARSRSSSSTWPSSPT